LSRFLHLTGWERPSRQSKQREQENKFALAKWGALAMIVWHLVVFACSLLADAVYGGYTISLARGHVLGAVSSSATLSILRTGMIVLCAHDWCFVPAAVLGEAAGTLCVLLVDKRINKKQAKVA
jgi:hypothetical protein